MSDFAPDYRLLGDMYEDDYLPNFLVDKIKAEITKMVAVLESEVTDVQVIQTHVDAMTGAINALESEFDEHNSEIETVARDSIAESVDFVLHTHGVDIDIEEALRQRDW